MKIGKRFVAWIEKKGLRKWFQRDNLIILILSGVLLMIIALPTKSAQGGKSSQPGEGQIGIDISGQSDQGGAGGDKASTGSETARGGDVGWLADSGQSYWGTGAQGLAGSAARDGTIGDGTAGAGTMEERTMNEGTMAEGTMEELERYAAFLEQRLAGLLGSMEGVGKVSVMISMQSTRELVLEKDQPIVRSNTVEQDGEGGSRSSYQVDSGESTVYSGSGSNQTPYVVKSLVPRVKGVVVAAQGAGTARISNDITEAVQALFDLEANQVKVVRMKSSD